MVSAVHEYENVFTHCQNAPGHQSNHSGRDVDVDAVLWARSSRLQHGWIGQLALLQDQSKSYKLNATAMAEEIWPYSP
jgi:hypothetical protein